MDAQSHVLDYKNLSFFFQNFDFFRPPSLLYLSNMPTSFSDKVPVLKYKIECEVSSIFGDGL